MQAGTCPCAPIVIHWLRYATTEGAVVDLETSIFSPFIAGRAYVDISSSSHIDMLTVRLHSHISIKLVPRMLHRCEG